MRSIYKTVWHMVSMRKMSAILTYFKYYTNRCVISSICQMRKLDAWNRLLSNSCLNESFTSAFRANKKLKRKNEMNVLMLFASWDLEDTVASQDEVNKSKNQRKLQGSFRLGAWPSILHGTRCKACGGEADRLSTGSRGEMEPGSVTVVGRN